MCLALPVKVMELCAGDMAIVDLGGVTKEISLALLDDVEPDASRRRVDAVAGLREDDQHTDRGEGQTSCSAEDRGAVGSGWGPFLDRRVDAQHNRRHDGCQREVHPVFLGDCRQRQEAR